jgi:hypothetical protein
VWGSIYGEKTPLRRKWNRSGDNGPRRPNGLDDLFSGLVDQVVIE